MGFLSPSDKHIWNRQYRSCGGHHNSTILGCACGGTALLRRISWSCFLLASGLLFPIVDIDHACEARAAINVTVARGKRGYPPSPTPFSPLERCVHPPLPPVSGLIDSVTPPFLRRDNIGNNEWRDSTAWWGLGTTTGRSNNQTIGGRQDTDPARDNGSDLATRRGARSTDVFKEGTAGHPGDSLAEHGIGSYRFRNTEKPPDQRVRGAARAAPEVDGEIPIIQWQDRLGARSSLVASVEVHFAS